MVLSEEEMKAMAVRNYSIVTLKDKGFTYDKLGAIFHLSPAYCRKLVRQTKASDGWRAAREVHRHRLFVRLESFVDLMEQHVFGEADPDTPPPPNPADAKLFLDGIKAEVALLGADEPKASRSTVSGTVTHEAGTSMTPHADRKAKRTAVLAELLQHHPLGEQEILDVDSYVELPTGDSTGAPTSNGYGPATNGHGPGSNGMH